MARRLVFYLYRLEDKVCVEVSETLLDCLAMRRKLGLSREDSRIDREWVDCGSGKK